MRAFDCLEFDASLRTIDVWSDAAFLGLSQPKGVVALWYQALPHQLFPPFPGVEVLQVDPEM